MTSRWVKWLWGLKLLIGGSLAAWLIVSVDAGDLLERLSRVNLYWLALVFIIPHIGILISCLKWRLLLHARGGGAGLWDLTRLYLVGTFFNNFFPSMVGGDVVRVYQLGRAEQNAALAVASIFMERFLGFAALVSMMPLALLLPGIRAGLPGLPLLLGLVLGAFVVASWILFRNHAQVPPHAVQEAGLRGRIVRVIRRSHWHITSYRGHGEALVWSYALSLLFHLSAGLTVWVATSSVGANLSLAAAICLTPLVLFAGAIPVSINGLGVVELGYVLAMGLVGVPDVDALSAALVLRTRLLFTTAVGGFVYMLSRDPVSRPPLDMGTAVAGSRPAGTLQETARSADADP